MLDTLLYVFLTLSQYPEYKEPVDICTKNVEHLTYNNQITFHIGCSEVNGTRVYPTRVLEDIYNGKTYAY